METRFTILLIELAVLIVVQCGVMIGLYMAFKKSSDKMMSLADDVHRRTTPILDAANAMVQNTRPQVELIVSNLAHTSETLKSQTENLNETVNDIVDRARLHVVRADELVSRTMDKVENTTEMVQHTVVSPVRQIAGILQGVTMGFNVLFGKRGGRARGNGHGAAVPGDEMFI